MSAVRKLTADVITYKKKSVMFLYALQKRSKKNLLCRRHLCIKLYIGVHIYVHLYFYLFSNMFRDRKQKTRSSIPPWVIYLMVYGI